MKRIARNLPPQTTELLAPGQNEAPEAGSKQEEQNMLSTAKGGSVLMFGRLVNYVTRFAITFALARLMGAENYGLYNLAVSAGMIAGAISVFGLDSTMTRYIAILNGRNDRRGVWGAIQIGVGGTLLLSVLTSTALFSLSSLIAEYVFHDSRLAPLLQLASLTVPFLALSDVLAGATRGFKRMSDTVIAQNIAQPLIRLILIVLLALVGFSIPVAILAFGAADLCASLILLYFLNKRFHLRRSLATGTRHPGEIIGFTVPLGLSDLMTTFRSYLQTLLIGSLDTIRGVGVFSIANQVNQIGNIFHASMNQSARPLIAELNDQGKQSQVQHIYQTTTRWVVTLNIPMILIVMLFPTQIISIFGKSFVEGAPALAIMGLVNLINVATGMCGMVLDMTGHTRMKLFNTTIRVSVAILANVLLIPRYGVTGAALAALIHEVIANLLPMVELWFLYHILPYNRNILKPLAAGSIAAAGALLLRAWVPTSNDLLLTLLHMLVVLAIYAAIVQRFGLSSEEVMLMNSIRRRVGLLLSRRAS
jgi:O-antigen/teichoic acid export membrane protein